MTDQPKSDDPQTGDSIEFRLKWPFGMPMQSVYANQFSVTNTGTEIILEFGEFLPTGLSNLTKDEIAKKASGLEIRPVARIILSPHGLKALSNLIRPTADNIILSGDQG